MASTYSTNLALELIGTGDQAGSWGNTTNTNLGTLIEQAISGYVTQAVATGTDTTITIPNGATGVARNMFIELTGTGGTNTNLIVPSNKKLYFVYNNASGAVTVKVSGQTGISVAAGEKQILVSNGTDIVKATSYITSGGSISFDSLSVTTITATSGTITNLNSTSANITTLTGTTFGTTATTQLRGASAAITTLTGTSADITTITGTTIGTTATTQLKGASATITNLSGTSANITTLTSASGTITNLLGTTLTISGNAFIGFTGNAGQGVLQVARTISGGGPATSGTTDTNQVMAFNASSVQFGYGAYVDGTGWIQQRATGNYATNYALAIQPNGGNVGIGRVPTTNKLEVSGTISDVVGNVRAIPRVGSAKTSTYTLAISDVGQYVEIGTGGGLDVPNGIFSTGDVVSVFNNTTGNRTISLTITTAYLAGTDADKNSVTLATRGIATILFISNSVCVLTGNLT